MNKFKRKKLQENGWKICSVQEFFKLSPREVVIIDSCITSKKKKRLKSK